MRFIWFSYSLKCLLVTVLLVGNWGAKLAAYPAGVSYDLRRTPLLVSYGNGASESRTYNPARGWLERIDVLDVALTRLDRTDYTRSASGRVSRQSTDRAEGKFDYTYDYTGRLLSAVNFGGQPAYNQTFTYDTAGSMRSNSALGTYDYGATNAAHPHAPTAVGLDQFTYDLNGNMTVGLGGKVMTYDAENRPLSVSFNGTTTSYVYGPDGTRLKKVEGADTTVYFGPVEIRKFGQGTAEEIILYPHPNVRLVNGVASYLHTDQLGSVRVITGDTGSSAKETVYRPFGETVDFITDPTATIETKGFIGERYDMDAGLLNLNARYMDPRLAMFIQPDWFEVTAAGVGTNRYAYSFNDPINAADPGGNATTYHSDGSKTNWDPDSPEHAAIACGCAAGAEAFNDMTRGYNDWRGDFVSNNPGSHSFSFGSEGVAGGLTGYGQGGVSVSYSAKSISSGGKGGLAKVIGRVLSMIFGSQERTRTPSDTGVGSNTTPPYRMRVQVQGTWISLPTNLQGIGINSPRPITVRQVHVGLTALAFRLSKTERTMMRSAFVKASKWVTRQRIMGGVSPFTSRRGMTFDSNTSLLRGFPGRARVDIEVISGHNLVH